MSYAFRARKKAIRRAKDVIEPERKELRNMIRNGRAPRFSRAVTRRQYANRKDKTYLDKTRIRYVAGVIMSAKSALAKVNKEQGGKKKGLLARVQAAAREKLFGNV